LGRAQDLRTPSISSLKSKCNREAWCSWTTKRYRISSTPRNRESAFKETCHYSQVKENIQVSLKALVLLKSSGYFSRLTIHGQIISSSHNIGIVKKNIPSRLIEKNMVGLISSPTLTAGYFDEYF
jgi:hypothetical protein